MAMAAGCSICSDSLFKTYRPDPEPGQPVVTLPNNVNAMVTPCGHAYHAYCITRWMTGNQLNSGSCPNCRKAIPQKKCAALFLDTYDVTLNESAFLPGDLGGSEDADALRRELTISNQNYDDCKTQRDAYKDQVKEIGETMQAISNENSSLMEQLQNERMKSDRYVMKYQQAESFKTLAEQKDSQLKKAEEELNKLTYIQDMLNGVKYETERDLKTFTNGQKSVASLIQMKNLLSQELDTLKDANKKEQKQREKERTERITLLKTIDKLRKEKEDMELVMQANPQGISAPGGSKDKDPPAAKKSKTDLNSTINVSSDEEAEDKDVGLLKRIGVIRRTGSSKSKVEALKRPVRSSSMNTRAIGARLPRDAPAEPLSPLNLRCKSGIPGLALGDVMIAKKVGTVVGGSKGQVEKRTCWKR